MICIFICLSGIKKIFLKFDCVILLLKLLINFEFFEKNVIVYFFLFFYYKLNNSSYGLLKRWVYVVVLVYFRCLENIFKVCKFFWYVICVFVFYKYLLIIFVIIKSRYIILVIISFFFVFVFE